MNGLNKVFLLGNLGADPELKITQGGQPVLKLRLATSETFLDRNQTRQERTEWHSVTLWGRRAEALAKILNKGDRIFVEGGLRTSTYEKDGEKRYRTEITAFNVILNGRHLGTGEQRENDAGAGGGGGSRRAPAAPPAPVEDEFGGLPVDDEIPFLTNAARRGWRTP